MSSLVRDTTHTAIARAFELNEFTKLMDKAMEREDKHSQKKSFAPSGLGYSGSCPRYWYYAFNGAQFEYDTQPDAMANMEAGSASGERLAKVLDKMGILVEAEKPAHYENPPIGGFIDAIVTWQGQEVVVEVKTTQDSTWNRRVIDDKVPGYQLVQLLIYMYTEGKDRGFFLTENKNTNQIWIKPVKMTPKHKELVENIFEWMKVVKKNADEGELPTRGFNKSSMQCKGCAVKTTCWEGWVRGSVNGSDPAPGTITLPVLELPK